MKHFLFVLLSMSLVTAMTGYAEDSVSEFKPRIQSHLREIHYTVGDIAYQTITIETPLGYRLDTSTLPKVSSRSVIEVRAVHSSFEDIPSAKPPMTRHRLTIDWQVFMALREVRTIPLLDIDLQFSKGDKVLPLHIAASEVIVSPLLPTKMDEAHLVPQPDVAPRQLTLRPYIYTLVAGVTGLLLSMIYLAWYAGWIRTGFDTGLPFRQAWQKIRKLRRTLRKQADANHRKSANHAISQSMVLLSRAFDQYAGAAISSESLEHLFNQHPHLGKQKLAITQFYADAQHVFFAGKNPSHSLQQLERLARQLSRQPAA
ncbi:hypothetical protein [Methyloradius palustris]|uniref:MxaA protein n=1 Tax=Methyloradius palustris TaxID=2778876 RepID=A0A8D5GA86_9PROT|nr:hypothetical protein [Methyloradius palustris]BCM24511.1 hypothetical protein ZMTM_07700 [Methyloradius palustris]